MEDFNMSLTLKDYLRQKFNFSSRLMTKIKKNKGLFLNGESAPGWIVPKENDVITVNLPKETIFIRRISLSEWYMKMKI